MSDSLNPGQRRAVEHGDGPLLVLAGPGSGKTRVVTRRAAALVGRRVPPDRILLVTFTRKAAAEMRARIGALCGPEASQQIWVGTFHATSARLLRSLGDNRFRAGRSRKFAIYDPADGTAIVRAVVGELGLNRKEFAAESVLKAISRLKGRGQRVGGQLDQAEPPDENFVRIWQGYEAAMERADAFDYDDLLTVVMLLSESDTSVGRAWRRRFDHVIVDEYQDTNRVQFRIVNALGAAGNICAVGDHRQSIYGFRGADWRNIDLFRERFPAAAEVAVDVNYRSTGHVVGCFNALFDDCTMTTPNEPGPLCDVRDYANSDQEAAAVTRHVLQRLDEGTPPGELAVLYRQHVLCRPVEEQLRHAGVNYQIAGGTGFYDRSEVRDVLSYLRLVVHPQSDVDAERVINLPPRKLGNVTVARLRRCAARAGCSLLQVIPQAPAMAKFAPAARKAMQRFHLLIKQAAEQLPDRPLTAVAAELIERSGLRRWHLLAAAAHQADRDAPAAERATARAERVEETMAAVAAYERRAANPTLEGFLEEVALITAQDELEGDKVSLMTIHAAKGLEFESVWVVGVERGLLPDFRATGDEAEREELRLMFVACSRAKRWLSLSYVAERFLYGKWERRRPSQFLDALPVAHRRWPERDALLDGPIKEAAARRW